MTARGTRHLEELAAIAGTGEQAILFIVVQRNDATRFRPADHIDPAWGKMLRKVADKGAEVLAYQAALDLHEIRLDKKLPIDLSCEERSGLV